jgi:uncharacterized SAM-binding protein YcdF (DUF218 family)
LLLDWIKTLVKLLVLPPAGPLLLALAGLAVAGRRPRLGRRIAFVGIAVLFVLAMPAVAGFLVRCLDTTPAFDSAKATDAQAIVILGGGTRRYAPEYGGATLSPLGLERVRYGARLARLTGLPVLVSGGSVDKDDPVEALLMRDVLTHEYGVPVRWVETRSHNTHENAVDSAAILKAAGIKHVILVVHSFDVPRARAEFEAAGLDPIIAPTGIPPAVPAEVGDFLPSPSGLQESYWALYEILGNALYQALYRLPTWSS